MQELFEFSTISKFKKEYGIWSHPQKNPIYCPSTFYLKMKRWGQLWDFFGAKLKKIPSEIIQHFKNCHIRKRNIWPIQAYPITRPMTKNVENFVPGSFSPTSYSSAIFSVKSWTMHSVGLIISSKQFQYILQHQK